jgi:hypothetical protein
LLGPASVSLDTGSLPADPAPEIKSIEWVRLTKAFSAGPDLGKRTVFVVEAASLPQFLSALELITDLMYE